MTGPDGRWLLRLPQVTQRRHELVASGGATRCLQFASRQCAAPPPRHARYARIRDLGAEYRLHLLRPSGAALAMTMADLMRAPPLDRGGADGPPTPSCIVSRHVGTAAAAVADGIAPPAAAPSPEPPSASEWGSSDAAPSPTPSPCETASGRPVRARAPRPLPEGFSPDGGEADSGDEATGDAGAQGTPRKFRGVWCALRVPRRCIAGRCALLRSCSLAALTRHAPPRRRLDRKRGKCAPTRFPCSASQRAASSWPPCCRGCDARGAHRENAPAFPSRYLPARTHAALLRCQVQDAHLCVSAAAGGPPWSGPACLARH